MNHQTNVDDEKIDRFDEAFSYDAQGRITSQRRGANAANTAGGEYLYYAQSNKLKKVSAGMSDSVDAERLMNADSNFVYDADGNMTYDASKKMTVSYDYRGLPAEFRREVASASGIAGAVDSVRLLMAYDGSGARIGKRYERKDAGDTAWTLQLATHYTGIGSEIRVSGLDGTAKVVVNLPQGLGRYAVASASENTASSVPSFEWYLKNHLGSAMLVYGTGSLKAAYDYRAFGEQVDLTVPADKVTENFTGKENDEETDLNYFGARYLDPMLGLWVSADAKRQFSSPYLYAGNGVNPVNGVDKDGNIIRSSNPANNQRFADALNSIASDNVRFYFNKKNELKYSVNANGSGNGSKTYAKTLMALADATDYTFNLDIDPSDKTLFKHGHGMTDSKGNITLDGAENVTMNSHGIPMHQSFAEILMHEIVGHLASMFSSTDITPNSDNAIDDDNIIRKESNLPLRQNNENHKE